MSVIVFQTCSTSHYKDGELGIGTEHMTKNVDDRRVQNVSCTQILAPLSTFFHQSVSEILLSVRFATHE